MNDTIRKNERCFIGMPSCGYGYESAKLCFVACPSDDRYTLKIDVIREVVESKQYECHVALKKIDPGSFAFCTKICSKIIQSQFCVVLLEPSVDKEGKESPNPNVHMEYGMMISQNKHVIPLQDQKYDLAFNISPLDTIKYTDANFKVRVTEAVDNAVRRFSELKVTGQVPQGPEIFTYYSLSGYKMSDISVGFYKLLYELGAHLGFFLFDAKGKYKYVGIFDHEDPKKIILHTKLLIDSIVSTYETLVSSNPQDATRGIYDYFVKDISVDITIPPFFENEDILNKINSLVQRRFKFPIVVHYRADLAKAIEDEYGKIGNIKQKNQVN